jgi:integrase
MAGDEKLPSGFERLPSGSIRVRLRIKGYAHATQTFPLFANTPEERRRQRLAAEKWAVGTRQRLMAGVHVSTRQAETTSLADALIKYRDERLTGKDTNVQKVRNRIAQIVADPISARMIASLSKPDLATYRDELQEVAMMLRGKPLARTTISNKMQVITRALDFVGETMHGVPLLKGVTMPTASPGRDRRVSDDEMRRLLDQGRLINAILPLIIRFAVLTALRRERILEFRLSYIHHVGRGVRAIRFPKEAVKHKRAGVIPVTQEIQKLLDEISLLNHRIEPTVEGRLSSEKPIFRINGNTFDYQWRHLVVAAKITNLHFHDLRHEATSQLFEKGLNVTEVMSITGHSTGEMVDRYTHYSAPLVFEKLEHGVAAEALAKHIRLLMHNFRRQSGDILKLQELTQDLFLPISD